MGLAFRKKKKTVAKRNLPLLFEFMLSSPLSFPTVKFPSYIPSHQTPSTHGVSQRSPRQPGRHVHTNWAARCAHVAL